MDFTDSKDLTPHKWMQVRHNWSKHLNEAEKFSYNRIWKEMGDMYCINLVERDDRYESAKRLFDELEMDVKFHKVKRHPLGGVQGCYESHIEIITKAYEEGKDRVTIFEDDIAVGKGMMKSKIAEALTMVKIPGINIIYLGWHAKVMNDRTRHVMGSLYKLRANGTHAYIINRPLMEKLANRPFDGTPIDVLLSSFPNTFGIYPTIFVQGAGDSDIVTGLSSSKWVQPVQSAKEVWSTQVNIPLQKLLMGIVFAIIAVVILHLLAPKDMLKKNKGIYVITFIAALSFYLIIKLV